MYKVKHKIQHGKGTLYNGPIDALVKIWKNEGLSAYLKVSLRKNRDLIDYYQGLRAGYPRHALQTILTMSLWDVMKRQYDRIKK